MQAIAQKIETTDATVNRGLSAVDRLMTWAGDHLNPILVKETRQALKSRQFVVTFALLLICGWAWSLIGLAMIGPDVYYSADGAGMFFGYYLILAFPLFVIVPFSAFRSIAGEQEDRTYELMSITTLGPRQIVRGKLGSAVLQMIVYLSAISPCLAFTYMLRGIDFPTILFCIGYTVLVSLALSQIALLIGTLTSERHWQVMLSVLLIVGLLIVLWIVCAITASIVGYDQIPFSDIEFWQVLAAMLTAYASTFLLVFYASAALITFPTENRSTRIRLTMVAQLVLFVGWMSWVWIGPARGEEEVVTVFLFLGVIYWYVAGTFLIGESPELSPRVKRDLPQSFFGRVFLTWLNPGPGTGYLFAVCGMTCIAALAAVAVLIGERFDSAGLGRWSPSDVEEILVFSALSLAYLILYLGVGLLLLRVLRRFSSVGILLSLILQGLLLTFGAIVPSVVHAMTPGLRSSSYSYLHIFNAPWTLIYIVDRSLPPETPVLLLVLPAMALLVLVLNLGVISREVSQVRIARPKRVAEEDAEVQAQKAPPQPRQISPWDSLPEASSQDS